MMNLIRFIALRNLRERWFRVILTVLGISLGISLFIGIWIINRSVSDSFRDSVEAISGKAALTITGNASGFPEAVLEGVIHTEGVKRAVPSVELNATFVDPSGKLENMTVLGIDLLKEQAVRSYKTDGDEIIDDPLIFLNQADSIIITREFAARHGLLVDSKFKMTTALGDRDFTVRGLLSPTGTAKAFGGDIAFMDIDAARMTFGREEKLDRIDIVLRDGANADVVADKLRTKLGAAFKVGTSDAQVAVLNEAVGAFQTMLSFLSTLALAVGVFLVGNSVNVSVAERRREIGMLRALGTTKFGILFIFMIEAALLGLCGAVIGSWAGRQLARLLVHQVAQTMEGQASVTISIEKLNFGFHDVALSLAIGFLTCLLASAWPAFKASRVRPVEALRPVETNDQTGMAPRFWTKSSSTGFLILFYLLACTQLKLAQFSLLQSANTVLGIVGTALIAPACVRVLIQLMGRFTRVFNSFVLRLSLENLLADAGRTSSNVLSLTIGLMLVIIIACVNDSFRGTSLASIDRSVRGYGQLVVSSNGRIADMHVQPQDEKVLEEINAVPGVKIVDGRGALGVERAIVPYDGRQIMVKGYDRPLKGEGFYFFDAIGDEEAIGRATYDGSEPATVISENFASRFGKKVGEHVHVETPTGPHTLLITGIAHDISSPFGVLLMPRHLYSEYWNDHLVTAIFVNPAAGLSVQELKSRLAQTVGRTRGLISVDTQTLSEQITKLIDENLSFNKAIELAALLVGLIGLMNTMFISVLGRTREFGMLRAVGMTRFQLLRTILYESLWQGIFGALVAVVLGGFLAWTWITSILPQMLGWKVDFYLPMSSIALTLAAGVGVAVVAGVFPALRASRLEVRKALEHEA
jgi:putative ABC transport system permease protein